MTILNLGSINVDHRLTMHALPLPGETVVAYRSEIGLGGKGANQSVAIARSGGAVVHLGAVGQAERWVVDELCKTGVDVRHVHFRSGATGLAFVMVSDDAENSIVLLSGANATIERSEIVAAIDEMDAGDWLLFQNETNGMEFAAKIARQKGMKIAFAAAPFRPDNVTPLLAKVDLLALNSLEFAQLLATGTKLPDRLALLVTDGAAGAVFRQGDAQQRIAAFPADPIDTTGAGDTFLGAFLALLDRGESVGRSLRFASAAAALQVALPGAASSIPDQSMVQASLDAYPDIVVLHSAMT